MYRIFYNQELEIFELMRSREIATYVAFSMAVINMSVSDLSQIPINSKEKSPIL